jgi:hypothetical protein
MRSKTYAFAVALSATTLASPAGASLSGFRLPGEQPQQERPPDVQGPVAPDVPASRRNPAAPSPTPTAARPSPAPTIAPQPIELPTGLRAPPPQANPARRSATPTAAAPTPGPTAAAGLPQAEPATAPSPAAAAPPPADLPAAQPAPAAQAGWSWRWLLGAVSLLLAALAAAAWGLRRRARRPIGPMAVPQIERPRVGPASPPPASEPAMPAEPLQVSLEPLRLSLTLMNATLAYRLALTNNGPAPLTGLAIGADMISAHASMSREEQLSGPSTVNGAAAQRIERLEPGETRVVAGEFRLPFPQIVPIRQGDAALLLPLARFRVEAEGARPLVRTFVVGQPGQGSGLQPFRLDLGPRVYPHLAQHAFA